MFRTYRLIQIWDEIYLRLRWFNTTDLEVVFDEIERQPVDGLTVSAEHLPALAPKAERVDDWSPELA